MILTRAETAEYLLAHDHYCILSHARPDGDTVGTSAALCRGLRALGKTAHVLKNEEVTQRFSWLHEGLTKESAEEGDTIVSTDVASPTLLPASSKPLLGRIDLRIDHHGTGTSFTTDEIVDPASASCAELVWDILKHIPPLPLPSCFPISMCRWCLPAPSCPFLMCCRMVRII